MRGRWLFPLVAAALVLTTLPATGAARPYRRSARLPGACEGAAQISQYPEPRGLAPLIVGASLFGFGIPTTIVGSMFLLHIDRAAEPGSLRGRPDAAYSFLIPGAVMIAVGVPLAVVGAVRFERFVRQRNDWLARHRVTPIAGRTPGGGLTAGLSLQF